MHDGEDPVAVAEAWSRKNGMPFIPEGIKLLVSGLIV